MQTYYEQRAPEYDRVYDKPERQADLGVLRSRVAELLAGRRVLEVAAGTGWWTTAIATAAASVHGIDLAVPPLGIARTRAYECPTSFTVGDALALDRVDGDFDAAFIGFLWSHLSAVDLRRHIDGLTARLPAGSPVVAIDNRYVSGSSTPISRTDRHGNTYQDRPLAHGSVHEVMKNFWTPAQLHRIVGRGAEVELVEHYWSCRFTVGKGSA